MITIFDTQYELGRRHGRDRFYEGLDMPESPEAIDQDEFPAQYAYDNGLLLGWREAAELANG